ncbi:MAG: putative ABC transporter permease [Bacillota bacterium]|jgi:uncharacterized membrane protein
MIRFMIYGIAGWCIEILWTGLWSAFLGDWRLISQTYIWMFFIYGSAVFLEPLHDKIRHHTWGVRGLIWVAVIFIMEYSAGFLLDTVIGSCPWNYASKTSFATVSGYIRLDYAPAWFIAGLGFEKLHDFLSSSRIY